jgi:hypothetical protein
MKKLKILPLLLGTLLILSIASMAKAEQPSNPSNLDSSIFQQGHSQSTSQNVSEENKLVYEKALAFLNNVAKLDTAKYTVETYVDERPGPNYDKTLKFSFSSTDSQVDVLCLINDNSVFWCTITPIQGQPAFVTTKTSDVLNTAKGALTELQTFSTKNELASIKELLNSVTEIKNSKTSSAEFTQEIIVDTNTVTISWAPTANGLSNPQNKLTLRYVNGNLQFFADYIGMLKIGSSESKISEQKAIEITTEHAKSYSWVQDNETVANVTVLSDPIIANLTLQNRGNATLYPYWDIWLPLDKMYPGGVTAFHVGIWADTGEIGFISPIGYGGSVQETSSESNTTSENNNLSTAVIAIMLIVATGVIVSYLFYKRKR